MTREITGEVHERRRQLWEQLGLNVERIVLSKQIHRTDVETVDERQVGLAVENASPYESADGLTTGEKNVFLSIFTADCLPIFLYEPEVKIVAAVHAGWKGVSGRIIEQAFNRIGELGGAGERAVAWVGPHIKVCHYRLNPDSESYAAKRLAFPDQRGDFLDLTREAVRQLAEQGVAADRLEIGECTACHPEKYYSYHMSGGQNCGIMMGTIGRSS